MGTKEVLFWLMRGRGSLTILALATGAMGCSSNSSGLTVTTTRTSTATRTVSATGTNTGTVTATVTLTTTTATNQDVADISSCSCNTPGIAEETNALGVSRIADRQASQDSSRLDFMRASLARARPVARSTGTWSPRPKYISSGVWPAKAEWGTTELCCST
jgi:hypothetical protein